jgi:AraC-like DNA-binding protein
MDEPASRWYFSKMPATPRTFARPPLGVVEFHRTKYGPELLVDAAFVRDMPTFRGGVASPHVLTFHDVLLVTRGRGWLAFEDRRHRVAPGTVVFTAPGEPRQLQVPGIDGACLFFTEAFVAEAFSDPRFLERFAFFRPGRPSPVLVLRPAQRRAFAQRFRNMRREIAALRGDAPQALRALLYELLVLLNRWYEARHRTPGRAFPSPHAERFRAMVERDFRWRHRVAEYARELGLTPGHLNTLCRAGLGASAGTVIRARITLEAKRRLAYGGEAAAAVGAALGFDDPAYFSRFFRRQAGVSPSGFRSRTGRTRAGDQLPERTARSSRSRRA